MPSLVLFCFCFFFCFVLFCFYSVLLWLFSLSCLNTNFRIVFFYFYEKCPWNFDRNCITPEDHFEWNGPINFDNIFPFHKNGISLHLFVSSVFSSTVFSVQVLYLLG